MPRSPTKVISPSPKRGDLFDLCGEGFEVLRITREDFDGERATAAVTKQTDDDLTFAAFSIAVVTEEAISPASRRPERLAWKSHVKRFFATRIENRVLLMNPRDVLNRMKGDAVSDAHTKKVVDLLGFLILPTLLTMTIQVGLAAESASEQIEPDREEGTPITLDPIVVTATRGERPSFDVPNAVTIVDREHVERQSPTVLPDLLRGEVGVFVQQTTPGQSAPIIRGLIGSSVLMLVDGMRLNTTFFRSAPNQYFALVDPYNVDRLEVIRGAGSTLYGSDAMGGVLNVITPIPWFTTDQWQLHGKALGQFSSADTSWVNRLSLQGGRSGVAMSGGFTYQDHNDLRGGGDIGVQRPSGYEVYAGDGTFFLERGNQDLLFSFQYLQQPKTPRFDELVPGFHQSQPSSAVFFFEPNDRLFVHGRYRLSDPLPFADGLEFHVAFQEINDDRRSRGFTSKREDRERNGDSLIGLTLQLTSQWRDWMTFTYGGDLPG